jgi:hypothetical protein
MLLTTMPKRNVAIIVAALLLSLICYSKIPQNNYTRLYQRATAMLDARYVEKIDQRQLFQGAMNGMMATLRLGIVVNSIKKERKSISHYSTPSNILRINLSGRFQCPSIYHRIEEVDFNPFLLSDTLKHICCITLHAILISVC